MSRTFPCICALALTLASAEANADDSVSLSFSQQVAESTAALRGEIIKSTLIKKATSEALFGQMLQNQLQRKATEVSETARPTNLVCGEMASQRVIARNASTASAEVMAAHRADTARSPGMNAQPLAKGQTPSARASMEAAYQRTNKYFCSPSEAARGICKPSADPAYQRMAGADQDAMYLFQTVDGGQTYEGRRGGAQSQAVEALINRIAYGPAPLEPLPAGSPVRATSTGRVLTEMERRYNGFLSMAVYSLRQAKASKQPVN